MRWSFLLRFASLFLLVAAVAAAGCMGTGKADLSYDGHENGTHQQTAPCSADGTVRGSGKIDTGQVDITVVDGSSNQIFSHTYTGSFDNVAESFHGASGTWSITATRSGSGVVGSPFSGHYAFTLSC
jgi:hypothetical protein